MNPVSVIIPTYNRASFLKRAVASVVGQENFSGEIIIVDDGSTDGTEQVVKSMDLYVEMKCIRTENNGPASARNRGVEEAQHELIAFLDSDDYWAPEKLSRQMMEIDHNPEYSISHTGEKWYRRGQQLNQKRIHKPQHGMIFDHCLKLCAVGMSTVVMKKKLFLEYGGFDPAIPCCEDYELWLRISSKEKFLLVDAPLTIKDGGREDQLSSIYRVGMDKFRIYAIEKLLRTCPLTDSQRSRAIGELVKKCQVYGNGCIKHGRPDEGRRYLALPQQYMNTQCL